MVADRYAGDGIGATGAWAGPRWRRERRNAASGPGARTTRDPIAGADAAGERAASLERAAEGETR